MPLNFCLSQDDGCCDSVVLNAAVTQGETVIHELAFTSDGAAPLDLTGYSAKMQIGFPSPLVLETSGPSNANLTIPTPANGIIFINIDSATSENFPVGVFPYDFFTISGGGQAIRWFGGGFTVNQAETPIP